MLINPELEEKVEKKYREMLDDKLTEDFLDPEVLGEVRIFINQKPSMPLKTFEIGSDLVYLGANM